MSGKRPAPIVCPICQVRLGILRQHGKVVLTYDLEDWRARCPSPHDDPALCDEVRFMILRRLGNGEID
jgi:hypothetical protein